MLEAIVAAGFDPENLDPDALAPGEEVLLAGVIVLATTIIVVNVVGEVSDGWWLPMMLTLLAGADTTAAGLILGTVHRIENRPGRVPG